MTKAKKTKLPSMDGILDSAKGQAIQSEKISIRKKETLHPTILVADVKRRAQTDTRKIKPSHVLDLAEVISEIGLIHPIEIDLHDRLIVGGHRLEAHKVLGETDLDKRLKLWQELCESSNYLPDHETNEFEIDKLKELKCHETFKRIRFNRASFDSEKDPQMAFDHEAAENEKRLDYTKAEVLDLYERLKSAGYEATVGKPKEGAKPIVPQMMKIIGKSRRTVQRILEKNKDSKPEKSTPSKEELQIRYLKKINQNLMEFTALVEDDQECIQGKLYSQIQKLRDLINAELS